MNTSTESVVSSSNDQFKLYKYRWVIISLYGLYSAINFAQFSQITIIDDIVEEYYNVSSSSVYMTGMIFMILFIILFIPTGHFVEKCSLRTTSIIGAGLTALANCLKLIAVSPDQFYIIILSQAISGIAEIPMLIIPSKIACLWFGANEVSTACSIGILGSQLGLALGVLAPTLMVQQSHDENVVREGLFSLFLYNAIISVVIFLLVILFFRSKPKTPPSRSQVELAEVNTISHWEALKVFIRNKDFMLVLLSTGINFGFWNTFGTILNNIFNHNFPNDPDDKGLGWSYFIAIVLGGVLGSIVFGMILDRTNKFKLVTFLVLAMNVVTTILVAVFILTTNKILTFIFIPIYGFFGLSVMVICFEYTIETTYPVPEAFGTGVLNAVIYFFGIIFVYILDAMFNSFGYVVGYVFILVIMTLGTISVLFVSPELRRRNANLNPNENKICPE